jgi:hypothetical protein
LGQLLRWVLPSGWLLNEGSLAARAITILIEMNRSGDFGDM